MTAPAITRGPWELRGPTQVYGNLQRDQNWTGDRVAVVTNPADAPVICAAWELLHAAEEFLDFFENNSDELAVGEEIRLHEKLRAAIAKARGGAA